MNRAGLVRPQPHALLHSSLVDSSSLYLYFCLYLCLYLCLKGNIAQLNLPAGMATVAFENCWLTGKERS